MPVVDVPVQGDTQERIAGAALRCIARWGVGKTTLDDVAREAGCSRATVYRAFPGGKDSLIDAVVQLEAGRLLAGLAAELAGADNLEELLVAALVRASRSLRDHAALQFVLAYEPEVILPRIAFRRLDSVFHLVALVAGPFLAPHVGDDHAARVAEWLVRLVLSYTLSPSPYVDMCDESSTRQFVRTFVLPGLPVLTATSS
jgi:AcrR family transcriptional regulator